MQISIRTGDDFQQLLAVLANELVDATIHFTLYQDLIAAYQTSYLEFRQSWTFWSLTIESHLDATAFRLCKIYDQYSGGQPTVNLRNVLETILANRHLFDEPHFRARLKDNPQVNSLATIPRMPDTYQLQRDIDSVSKSDALVKKFTIWRNNFYSHRSSHHALDAEAFVARYPLHIPDIEALLKRGMDIVNRYSNLLVATTYSTKMVGNDDYQSVLKAIRADLDAREARFQEEIKRFSERDD